LPRDERARVTRCGYVAVLGAPNVGKSTLVNRLVGSKVSIVSAKPQTTRIRVAAVLVAGQSQMVLLDLPGIFQPRRRLDRAMIDAAWRGVAEADHVLLVVDATRGFDERALALCERLAALERRADVVINKVDAVPKQKLLALAAAAQAQPSAARIFMISAATGDGVDDVRAHLAAAMPEGPWLFPEDQLTDLSERLFAAEITREQVFRQLHEELPYAIAVETEAWTEREDGSTRVEQTIYVEREGQKGIVIGAGGSRLKAIGAASRQELVSLLGRPIHLFLNVRVKPEWSERPGFYRTWGLEYGGDRRR
jgi:GTP-binding protein Era